MIRIVAMPRACNPYQELLHSHLLSQGVEAVYFDGPTRSRTVNLGLAPAMLGVYRRRGYRILHIHWVYGFVLPWGRNRYLARRIMQMWFAMLLLLARLFGFQIVWTAHNVLPHERVFANDLSARRTLIRRCDAVIAHSRKAADEIERLGAANVHVIAQGSYVGQYPSTLSRVEARSRLGVRNDDFVVEFFGTMRPYKGVEDLVFAVSTVSRDHRMRLVLAGDCPDERYRRSLLDQTSQVPGALARLEHIPDHEVQTMLLAADVVVLPFKQVTNTGSALLVLSFGRPLLIPALPELADFPDEAVFRYCPGRAGLQAALQTLANADQHHLEERGERGREYAAERRWESVAQATADVYAEVAKGERRTGQSSRRRAVSRRPVG